MKPKTVLIIVGCCLALVIAALFVFRDTKGPEPIFEVLESAADGTVDSGILKTNITPESIGAAQLQVIDYDNITADGNGNFQTTLGNDCIVAGVQMSGAICSPYFSGSTLKWHIHFSSINGASYGGATGNLHVYYFKK